MIRIGMGKRVPGKMEMKWFERCQILVLRLKLIYWLGWVAFSLTLIGFLYIVGLVMLWGIAIGMIWT